MSWCGESKYYCCRRHVFVEYHRVLCRVTWMVCIHSEGRDKKLNLKNGFAVAIERKTHTFFFIVPHQTDIIIITLCCR